MQIPDDLANRIKRWADPEHGITVYDVLRQAMDNFEAAVASNTTTPEESAQALQRLKSMRGTINGVSVDEMISTIHEGHRY